MTNAQRRGDELTLDDVIIRNGKRFRIVDRPIVDDTMRVRFVVEGPGGHHDICLDRGATIEVDVTLGERRADQLAARLRIDLDGAVWRIVYAGPSRRWPDRVDLNLEDQRGGRHFRQLAADTLVNVVSP